MQHSEPPNTPDPAPAIEKKPPKKAYMFEKDQPFARSLLWTLQEQYYATRGVEAWKKGDVPHYITNNPVLANSYVEIVLALLRDRKRLGTAGEPGDEPFYICELGAGMGRFAFHFLNRLTQLCEESRIKPESFCYILTDQAERNLHFWRQHPCFESYIARGMLDVAIFDTTNSGDIALQISGKTISAGSLKHPLTIIANYLFDSIPPDLFYISDRSARRGLVSLITDEDPNTLGIEEIMDQLELHYSFEPLSKAPYEEPLFQRIFEGYQRSLTDTYLFFPAVALHCIQRLKALSKTGLLLLTADKGDHELSQLDGKKMPGLTGHGSVSMNVNYHAFKMYCEDAGGLALFPYVRRRSLCVGCCLMVPQALQHVEVEQAYRRHVGDFGPDDFYVLIKHAAQFIEKMDVEEIVAYLRLCLYDGDFMGRSLGRLIEMAPQFGPRQHAMVVDAIERVSDLYFPVGERPDLHQGFGCLLYIIDEYESAAFHFEESMKLYDALPGTLCNLAACYRQLGRSEEAAALVRKVLESEPENEQANRLMQALSSHPA